MQDEWQKLPSEWNGTVMDDTLLVFLIQTGAGIHRNGSVFKGLITSGFIGRDGNLRLRLHDFGEPRKGNADARHTGENIHLVSLLNFLDLSSFRVRGRT